MASVAAAPQDALNRWFRACALQAVCVVHTPNSWIRRCREVIVWHGCGMCARLFFALVLPCLRGELQSTRRTGSHDQRLPGCTALALFAFPAHIHCSDSPPFAERVPGCSLRSRPSHSLRPAPHGSRPPRCGSRCRCCARHWPGRLRARPACSAPRTRLRPGMPRPRPRRPLWARPSSARAWCASRPRSRRGVLVVRVVEARGACEQRQGACCLLAEVLTRVVLKHDHEGCSVYQHLGSVVMCAPFPDQHGLMRRCPQGCIRVDVKGSMP